MLVLSRRANESIVLSGGIRITVVETGRGRVKLGIDAPRHIRVARDEILSEDQTTLARVGMNDRFIIDCGAHGELTVAASDVLDSIRLADRAGKLQAS